MPAIATLCDGCHHPEDEHHIKKESWLECFHPGCNCESYKGFAYWNERENLVDIDHSARLAEGQKRWGSRQNAYGRKTIAGVPGGTEIAFIVCQHCDEQINESRIEDHLRDGHDVEVVMKPQKGKK